MPPSLRIAHRRSTARPSASDAATSTSPSTTQSRSPAGSTSRCVTFQFCASETSSSEKYSGDRASRSTAMDACPLRQNGSISSYISSTVQGRARSRAGGYEASSAMSSSSPSARSCTQRNAAFRTITRNARPEENATRASFSAAALISAASSMSLALDAATGSFSASHSSMSDESTCRIVSPSHASRSSTASLFRFAGTFCTRDLYASVRYRSTTPSDRFSAWCTTYLLKSNPSSYISRATALGLTVSLPTYGCALRKCS
mmetsp:Transcript_10530/g.44821  ORF Transcript_10530/g.44821 Transcript_10530/m.44821 type:complete len:260 (-) Transcript_10530:2062-2841(-)